MKKIILSLLTIGFLSVSAYACIPWFPQTCKKNFVWNEDLRCWTIPYVAVHGKPVCVYGINPD